LSDFLALHAHNIVRLYTLHTYLIQVCGTGTYMCY